MFYTVNNTNQICYIKTNINIHTLSQLLLADFKYALLRYALLSFQHSILQRTLQLPVTDWQISRRLKNKKQKFFGRAGRKTPNIRPAERRKGMLLGKYNYNLLIPFSHGHNKKIYFSPMTAQKGTCCAVHMAVEKFICCLLSEELFFDVLRSGASAIAWNSAFPGI